VFVLEVSDRKHLARVMKVVRHMPDVLRTVRTLAASAHGRDAPEISKDDDS
jgi:hypothetical protein